MKEILIWNIIEISASLIECFLLTNYIVNSLEFKLNKHTVKKYCLLLGLTICNNLFISRLVVLDSITGAVQIIIAMLFSFIFMQGTNFKRIFVSFTSIFLILIINAVTLSAFNKITSQDIEVLVASNGIFRILILFITKFLYFIVTKIVIKIFKKNDYGISKEEGVYILCIFIITTIIGNIMFEYVIRHEETNGMFFNFIFLTLIMINIFSYVFLRRINKNYYKKIDSESEDVLFSNKIINEIEMHIGYVNDIKKLTNEHLKTVGYLVKNKFYNEAEQYIDKVCSNDMTIPVKSIHTGSKLINLIINTKLYICYVNNISINFNVTGSIDAFSEKDICIILAVVFDETTKFCISCPEPVTIDLQISDNNGYLSIIVMLTSNNIIINNITEYMNNISSEIINTIVKKYNGAIAFNNNPNSMTVNLWLSIDKAKSYPKNSLLTPVER